MKRKEILNMMNVIDDDLIENASPQSATPKKRTPWLRYGMLAACITLVVAISLALLSPLFKNNDDIIIPSPDENPIEVVNPYESLYNKLSLIGGDNGDEVPAPDTSNDGASDSAYQEVTDNQVEGVIEGDLFKRTNDYIFYLANNRLMYYRINGEEASNVQQSCYSLVDDSTAKIYTRELYLSSDGKTATVVFYYDGEVKAVSLTLSYNGDLVTAEKKAEFTVKGTFCSSRMVNDRLILLTGYNVFLDEMKKDSPITYVPSYNSGNGFETVGYDCIIEPETVNSLSYKALTVLDGAELKHSGTMAFLSYSSVWYVTGESIYLTYGYTEKTSQTPTAPYTSETLTQSMTGIVRISYGEGGLVNRGEITLNGRVKDQYCLDEYNGILRVVTSVDDYVMKYKPYNKTPGFGITTHEDIVTASLFCVDISSMQTVASVERFAPTGENVRSARFDKSDAYVCTSVNFTDPVFYFDLTDLNNITYKDTGTIEGFSSSLRMLGNGYLLGFGSADGINDKIEIYKETETGVEIAGTFTLANFRMSGVYKSYYIDTENQIIGFPGYDYSSSYSNNGLYYYVLSYTLNEDGTASITQLIKEAIPVNNSASDPRGILIDGYYYIISIGKIAVHKI